MKRLLAPTATIIAILTLAAFNLHGATYVVSNTSDSGPGSLRQAILDANAGGGGNISMKGISGTITLTTNLPAITAGVNILGPGTSALTISGSNSFLIFTMNAGTTNTLSDVTLANGYAHEIPDGGGPPKDGLASGVANLGSLKIRNCVIRGCDNEVTTGGGVFNSGSLEMDACLIADCIPVSMPYDEFNVDGGGVWNSGTLTMNGCTISNCVADAGAGIYTEGTCLIAKCVITGCSISDPDFGGGAICNNGTLTVASCVLSNNGGGWEGAGVYSGGNLAMTNTAVMNNLCKEGGGLYLSGGNNSLVNCTISGNDAWLYGGGGIENWASLSMVGCTITKNQCEAQGGGGAGIWNLGLLAMTNCTVSGNSALPSNVLTNSQGGGILTGSSNSIVLVDCTVVSNTIVVGGSVAGYAGGIATEWAPIVLQDTIVADNAVADLSGPVNSQAHNLIKNTGGYTMSGDATGNLYGVDPLLGPLQNNGGPTATHALLPGSPAIDAGPTNVPPFVDQRGAPRPFGVADDIGAYEFGSVPCCRMCSLAVAITGGFQVKLSGIPGFTYTVQKSASPFGPWTPFTSVTIDVDGNGVCLDSNPGASSGFYRTAKP